MNGRCDFCPRPGRLASCHCEYGHRDVGVWVCAEKHESLLNSIEIACRPCYEGQPSRVVALFESGGEDKPGGSEGMSRERLDSEFPLFRVLVNDKGFPTGSQACSWCGATTSDRASRDRHEAWHLDRGDTAPDA